MQKLKFSRRQLFEQVEKSHLAALPNSKYQLRKILTCTVGKNYHVYLPEDKHYYSVPYRLTGNKINLFYTDNAVEIVYKNERVAIHQRIREHGYSTNKEHMPPEHKYFSDWNPEKILEMASNVGEWVKRIAIKIMDQSKYPEQGFKSCIGIIQLSRKFENEKVDQACRKAIHFNTIKYLFVKNVLMNNQEKMEEEPSLFPDIEHENIRGKAYYS